MNVLFRRVMVRSYEVGLVFRADEFRELLGEGTHWIFDPLQRVRVEVVSQRDPWLVHSKLDLIVKSGALEKRANVIDLKDYERALVWIDGRFSQILAPGLYAYWTGYRDVKVEIVDARTVRFAHPDLPIIVKLPQIERVLDVPTVEAGHTGILFVDGEYAETLPPGRYAFWKNIKQAKLLSVSLREAMFDISGQEIMTADKVTLRLNAVVTYRVADARLSVSVAEDARQSLYREAQLALRAVIGGHELDRFLAEKEAVSAELEEAVRRHASTFGLETISVGIRDVILPGEMKELMNKVTEAKKGAEANLIIRREETAALRSQANTAKLLQENPTLMRMRELEVLEKVAASSKLNVILGEKGLAERIVNLI